MVGLLVAPAAGAAPITTFDVLKAMNDEQQETYLAKHPELAIQLANTDPDAVHDEWRDLDADTRTDAIETLPEVVGNLDGVDYRDREKANRRALSAALATQKKRAGQAPGRRAGEAGARLAHGHPEDPEGQAHAGTRT